MRRQSIFWGMVVTLIGVILLINQIWSFDLFRFMVPSLFILVGLWFLIIPNTYSRQINEEHVIIPMEDISEADISLQHGAGFLNINACHDSQNVLDGIFKGGVDQTVDQRGDQLKIKLQTPPKFIFPSINSGEGLNWSMGLTPHVPLKLDIKCGANESKLDLSDLIISHLKLETGASKAEIKMPSHAGHTGVQIQAGASSIEIRIPEGVAARISTKGSGISDIHVAKNRFLAVGEGFESPDFHSASNSVDISIEVGLGSINIR